MRTDDAQRRALGIFEPLAHSRAQLLIAMQERRGVFDPHAP
ncbi:hypothetical protein [Haematobacter missouriensis]|nr:hypothetical protein [Haematobacter missouriensis]